MITSMTGFASLTREDELAAIGVTVRSVNHRYLDVQIRAPQSLAPLEPEVRGRVQGRVARGRVELTVTLAAKVRPEVEVEIGGDRLACDRDTDVASPSLRNLEGRGAVRLGAGVLEDEVAERATSDATDAEQIVLALDQAHRKAVDAEDVLGII